MVWAQGGGWYEREKVSKYCEHAKQDRRVRQDLPHSRCILSDMLRCTGSFALLYPLQINSIQVTEHKNQLGEICIQILAPLYTSCGSLSCSYKLSNIVFSFVNIIPSSQIDRRITQNNLSTSIQHSAWNIIKAQQRSGFSHPLKIICSFMYSCSHSDSDYIYFYY